MAIGFYKIYRRLIITLMLGAVLLMLLGGYLLVGCLTDGNRAGHVIKFSRKGYVIKTWEGELVQQSFSSQTDTLAFTVRDAAVAKQVNDALATGDRVTLHYCQKYHTFFWQGDSDYIIDAVTVFSGQ